MIDYRSSASSATAIYYNLRNWIQISKINMFIKKSPHKSIPQVELISCQAVLDINAGERGNSEDTRVSPSCGDMGKGLKLNIA